MLTTTLSHVERVGGPVPVSPGFPIEAFGNDGLYKVRAWCLGAMVVSDFDILVSDFDLRISHGEIYEHEI